MIAAFRTTLKIKNIVLEKWNKEWEKNVLELALIGKRKRNTMLAGIPNHWSTVDKQHRN